MLGKKKRIRPFVFWKNRRLERNITTLSDLYGLLGLSRQIGQTNSGAFGVFLAPNIANFGTMSTLSMFSIIQPLFLQKVSFDSDLNLGRKELRI